MYGIYIIYSSNDLIYIGKTKNFYKRIKNHIASQSWGKDITHIEIAQCKNKLDMDLYEKYYINKLKPKYNKAIVYDEAPSFKIQKLNFKKITLEEFINEYKPAASETKDYISLYEKRKNEINELLKKSKEIKEGKKIDFLNSDYTTYHWKSSSENEIIFLSIVGETPGIEFFKELIGNIKNEECTLIDGYYIFKFKNREYLFDNYKQYDVFLKLKNYFFYEKGIRSGFDVLI